MRNPKLATTDGDRKGCPLLSLPDSSLGRGREGGREAGREGGREVGRWSGREG